MPKFKFLHQLNTPSMGSTRPPYFRKHAVQQQADGFVAVSQIGSSKKWQSSSMAVSNPVFSPDDGFE